MADFLIGLDNGGSEIKCAVYDKSGKRIVGRANLRRKQTKKILRPA